MASVIRGALEDVGPRPAEPARQTSRTLRRALGIVALALVAAGCGLVRPKGPGAPGTVDAERLLASLEARREATHSLRARARLKAGLAGVWTRQAVLVQRPDDVRVDVLSPFGLALAVGTANDLLWIYPAAQGVRYEGVPSAPNVARFLGTPLAVADLVDILLGVPPARRAVGAPSAHTTGDGTWEIVVPLEDGHQTLWFAGDTGELHAAEERRGDGVTLRLGFDDYRDGFPWALEIAAPALGQAARVAYDAVERNVPLDSALFAPPPAPRVLPLDAATAG